MPSSAKTKSESMYGDANARLKQKWFLVQTSPSFDAHTFYISLNDFDARKDSNQIKRLYPPQYGERIRTKLSS